MNLRIAIHRFGQERTAGALEIGSLVPLVSPATL